MIFFINVLFLLQFFEEFVTYKFTEREVDAVFTVAVWPQVGEILTAIFLRVQLYIEKKVFKM